jgi:hypothetical protein
MRTPDLALLDGVVQVQLCRGITEFSSRVFDRPIFDVDFTALMIQSLRLPTGGALTFDTLAQSPLPLILLRFAEGLGWEQRLVGDKLSDKIVHSGELLAAFLCAGALGFTSGADGTRKHGGISTLSKLLGPAVDEHALRIFLLAEKEAKDEENVAGDAGKGMRMMLLTRLLSGGPVPSNKGSSREVTVGDILMHRLFVPLVPPLGNEVEEVAQGQKVEEVAQRRARQVKFVLKTMFEFGKQLFESRHFDHGSIGAFVTTGLPESLRAAAGLASKPSYYGCTATTGGLIDYHAWGSGNDRVQVPAAIHKILERGKAVFAVLHLRADTVFYEDEQSKELPELFEPRCTAALVLAVKATSAAPLFFPGLANYVLPVVRGTHPFSSRFSVCEHSAILYSLFLIMRVLCEFRHCNNLKKFQTCQKMLAADAISVLRLFS